MEELLQKFVPEDQQGEFKRLLYGKEPKELKIHTNIISYNDTEIKCYKLEAQLEELRPPRLVRVGLVQMSTTRSLTDPLQKQRDDMFAVARSFADSAASCGVNVLCFSELSMLPFFLCTREVQPWCQWAESAEDGPTVQLAQELAHQHHMVVVVNVLEREESRGGIMWNTAVVISSSGRVLGKTRKNHVPRVGDCNETTYYGDGDLGHPVFQTEFGRIAVNICYGRHHPQNWMMYGINGAEIVFNPSAIGHDSEPMWAVEARNAAFANSFFACAINRVGVEKFPRPFSCGDGNAELRYHAEYVGSSYVAAPDGSRTPGLSRVKQGLLVAELDLNMCTQARDQLGLKMTQRLDLYAKSLTEAAMPNYKPHVIHEN